MNNNTNGSHHRYNPRGRRQGEPRYAEQDEPRYREQPEPRYREQDEPRYREQNEPRCAEQYEPRYREQPEPRYREQAETRYSKQSEPTRAARDSRQTAEHTAPSVGSTRTSLGKEAKRMILMCVAGVIGLALLLVSINSLSSVIIGGNSYSKDAQVIDLKDAGITDIKALYKLTDPECVDIRGNEIPADQVMGFIEKYPDCQTLWSVRVGEQFADCDDRHISVPGLKVEDVHLLSYFERLESVDARGADYEVVEAIYNLGLDCDVQWDIEVGGQRYAPDTTELVTGAATDAEIRRLPLLTGLTNVDASGCTAYEALAEVVAQMPQCTFFWTMDIAGIEVSSTDETLDFNRTPIEDIAALEAEFEKLRYLPNLKKVDMCGCGVPNEKMAEWREKYPDTKFVWEITFGEKEKSWTVRTDIQVFSTLMGGVNPKYVGDQETFRDLFLYCTDLKVLDLGHNRISDISLITNLKQLQAVILMDNPISDLSPLGELPELKFAEIIKTDATSLEFAKNCPKLVHIDASLSEISEISALAECKELKYCVLFRCPVSADDVNAIKAAVPGVRVAWFDYDYYFKTRNSPLRSEYRLAATNYMYIENFNDWTDFTFVNGADLTIPTDYERPEHYGLPPKDYGLKD